MLLINRRYCLFNLSYSSLILESTYILCLTCNCDLNLNIFFGVYSTLLCYEVEIFLLKHNIFFIHYTDQWLFSFLPFLPYLPTSPQTHPYPLLKKVSPPTRGKFKKYGTFPFHRGRTKPLPTGCIQAEQSILPVDQASESQLMHWG